MHKIDWKDTFRKLNLIYSLTLLIDILIHTGHKIAKHSQM